MLRARRPTLVLVVLAMSAGTLAQSAELLASAPIDTAVFRDGEVQRSATPYGSWTLVCDAIPRLGRRFCSLRSTPAALDAGTLDLTVSTGDDGRPAVLLHLPLGLSLPFGVHVKAAGQGGPERRIPIALCSATACEAVWSLGAGDLAALRAGPGLKIIVQGWRFAVPGRHDPAPAPAVAMIGGDGFTEAVAASLR